MTEEVEMQAAAAATAADLQDGEHVGAALRTLREARGLSVADISALTRIRPAHVEAIESLSLGDLPSRPFTIGYLRAYAQALGLPGDAAVARFKADDPDWNDALRPPVGVRRMADPRLRLMLLAGLLILSAIFAWNLIRRGSLNEAPQGAATPVSDAPAMQTPTGPMTLGAPLPAPVESNAPPAYLTPGLEAVLSAALPETLTAREDPTLLDMGETFVSKGAIYGAPAGSGRIVVQARRPTTLIVWGPDGAAWFARKVAAGDAYRAPSGTNLVFETVEAGVMAVFVEGQARGVLPSGRTPTSALAIAPTVPARSAPTPAPAPKP